MTVELIPQEIRETPEAIRATVRATQAAAAQAARRMRERGPRRIYITGNGTSYYSSLAASYTARTLAPSDGPAVSAMMAGDLLHFTPALAAEDVVIGVSASGEFRDILALFRRLEGQCLRIGITHVPGSSITTLADLTLVSSGGPSRVPVMTKTYASTLTAIHLLLLACFQATDAYIGDLLAAADGTDAALADAGQRIPALVEELHPFEHAFCYGAGSGYAAALECALKLKEMALLHAEGSETWEMASGPATMINQRTLCIGLYTGAASDEATADVARHTRQWGARVLEIGPRAQPGHLHLPLTPPRFAPFASLPLVAVVALLAYRLAHRRGVNPDVPGWRDRYLAQGLTHIIGDSHA